MSYIGSYPQPPPRGNIVDLDVILQFMQWILEVKRGLKSNSVRSGQPTYEACDDNLDARILVAPIKFILYPKQYTVDSRFLEY